MVMKYRTTSGCVTVIGPPRAICSQKIGTTLPALPSTFPNRTATKRVLLRRANRWTIISVTRLLAPITELGRTALSVETSTNASTALRCAASASAMVPRTLFFTASQGFFSIISTCLCAAACSTRDGRYRSKIPRTRASSVMSAINGTMPDRGAREQSSRSMWKRAFSS